MPSTSSAKARLRAARERRRKVKLKDNDKDQKSNHLCALVDKSDSILWDALHPYGHIGLSSSSKSPPSSPDRSLSTASTSCSDSPSQSGSSPSRYHHRQREPRPLHSYAEPNKGTRLCELLWARQWEKVQAELLHQHSKSQSQQWSPLPCFSNGAAGLPLHLACAMRPLPPHSVIQALLEVNPQAVQQKASMWGLLPLHLAVDLRGTASATSSNSNKTDTGMTSMALSSGNDNDNEDNVSSLGSTATVSSNVSSLLHQFVDDESEDNRAISIIREEEMTNQCRIVRLLLNSYPAATTTSEEFQGMLPLHIAVSTTATQANKVPPNSAQVLQLLLENAPETLAVRDHAGDTPVIMAQRSVKQQSKQHHAAPKKMGSAMEAIPTPSQIIVSRLPDWKWNPILYPTARNHDGTTNNNEKKSDDPLLGRHNISSLLVSSLDDLMNLSTSSESGSDYFLHEYDLYDPNSSDDSDTARNSAAIIATSSSSDSDDDDSIQRELQQLEYYQADLRRELEESIRLHCYSGSPILKGTTDIKLEKYDDNDDKHVPTLVMTTSEDTTAAPSLSNDDYQPATGRTAEETLESATTVSLDDTINRVHRIMNQPVSIEGFYRRINDQDDDHTAERHRTLYCASPEACDDDGIESASFDQELERLETFESNLRQELESAKSFASFLKYSFDNQHENNRGNNRCLSFEDQVKDTCLTAQAEDSADEEAKNDIEEYEKSKAEDFCVVGPILTGTTEKMNAEEGEGASEVRAQGSLCRAPLHQDEEFDKIHHEEVLPPLYVDSISENALAEPPALEVAMRPPVNAEGNSLQIGQSHFNEDNSRKQAPLSVSLPLSFSLSDQGTSSRIVESDTWDEISLSEADTIEHNSEEDTRCVEALDDARRPKIEPHLLEKPTQGIRKSILNNGAIAFSCESFPSQFYGLPDIQESQSFSEVDDADGNNDVDENLTTEREASFVSENETDAKATGKDAATHDNLDFDPLDHDLQHPSNSNTEAVVAESGDVVIVWKRMTSSKPRFQTTAGQGHKRSNVDKSESRARNEIYISWQRVIQSTIKGKQEANPRVTDPPLISWARVPSTDSIQTECRANLLGNLCSNDGIPYGTHPTSDTTDDDRQTAVRGPQKEKLPSKDKIRCSPQGNLTQLTDQLQRLQAENRSQTQEMERLKRRLSIITEIKGVHYDDLRKALHDMCDKEQTNNNTAAPATSSISVADVLDDWYQELKVEQAEISTSTNIPDCLLQTESSLSQPHSNNDRSDKWMNSTSAAGNPVLTYMPMPLSEPRRGPPMLDVANEVLNKSDLGSNFNDWCKELFDEGSQHRDIQTPTPLSVDTNKTDDSIVGLEISISDVAVPNTRGTVTRKDESYSSILGLKIEKDNGACSQHLPKKEKEVVLTPEKYPEHTTSKPSLESQKDSRQQRLLELVRNRKSQRPFLDAKAVAKKLFHPNALDSPSKNYQLDLLDQTFEDIWRTGLPPSSSSNRMLPTSSTVPPIIICDPRSLMESSKTYVLSGPVEDIVGDLLDEERWHQSKVSSSFDWLSSVENTKVNNMAKRTKITVVEKACTNEGITDPKVQSYCTNYEPPPVTSTGCSGMSFGDLWASIQATDEALASVEQLANQAHDSFGNMLGCNNASSPFDVQGAKEATPQNEQEQLMSCTAWLHKERQNLDESQVSPGFVTFMDQLLSDVEKTVSGLSQYIQTLSRCNTVEQRNDVIKKAKHSNRRPSSSDGGSTIADWSLRRSGWL